MTSPGTALGMAPRPFAYEIFLEGKAAVPPSNNELKRMHWAKYRRIRESFAWVLQRELIRTGFPCLPCQAPKMRVLITIHSHVARARRLDSDNLWGGCKPLIDAMRDAGLIRNDSPKWLDLGISECREPGWTGTRIEFEEAR